MSEFAEFDRLMDEAPAGEGPEGVLPHGLGADEFSFGEFTVEERHRASEIKNESTANLICAFLEVTSGEKFSSYGPNINEWEAKAVMKFCALCHPFSPDGMRSGPFGSIDPDVVERLTGYDAGTLKAAILAERPPAQTSVTSRSLIPIIFMQKGIQVKEGIWNDGSKLYECAVLSIPGYDSPTRTVVRIGTSGVHLGRVISGGEQYCEWYNFGKKTHLSYVPIHPHVRDLALLFHQRYQLVVSNGGKGITFKVRNPPGVKLRGIGVRIAISSFGTAMFKKLPALYAEAKNRPSYAIGTKSELDIIEWLMDIHYSRTLQTPEGLKEVGEFIKRVRKSVDDVWVAVRKEIAPIMKENMAESLLALCRGTLILPNTGMKAQFYKNVLDAVEASRTQERHHDVATEKVDGPGFSRAGGSHMTVPAKWENAIKALKHVLKNPKVESIDAVGVGRGCHWQAQLIHNFPDAEVLYSDLVASYTTPISGKFIPRDATDPESFPPESGRGKTLLSDVFPGQGPKKASFGAMLDVYLSADYDNGVVKCYMGADADEATPLDGRTAPGFLARWTAKYDAVFLVPGGGPHSPEYFVVFGARRSDRVGYWEPPERILGVPNPIKPYPEGASPPPKAAKSEVKPKLPDIDRVAWSAKLSSYYAKWLAVKALDLVKMNYWKGPYAFNGVQACPPTLPQEGGPIHKWHFFGPESVLYLTAKGTEKGTTRADTEQPRVLEETLFSDL